MTDNILMSLAICNMVNKTEKFEKKVELSKTISELITPIVKEREQDDREDKDKELPKTVTQEITERRDRINKIKKEKEKTILTILGQMYNGVIIPEELTVRRGEFFRYRCQYSLSLDSVKQELLKNLHAVSEKITNSKNLDILEFVLSAWDKEIDSVSNSYYSRDNKNKIKKDLRFDELVIIENTRSKDTTPNTSFDILHTNGVCVYDNGDVEFFYQMGEDRDSQSFQTENFNALYLKFKDKIKQLAEDFIKDLDNEIKKRTDDLEKIKLKGSHLLMSAELQKGSNDIQGFN